MSVKKITDNEIYNVYKCNNSGMFACVDFYTVGKEGWHDEFKFSGRKDIAHRVCKKLNKEQANRKLVFCMNCETEQRVDNLTDRCAECGITDCFDEISTQTEGEG